MGTCCCGNTPPEKFVGKWTDDQHVDLTIYSNGNIVYQKHVWIYSLVFLLPNILYYYYFQTEHTKVNFNGPTRYKENEFFFCCCCCSLRGAYTEDENSEPTLIANGTLLKRK